MRARPFSKDLEEASSSKDLRSLYEEIGKLLHNLFNTDKRKLNKEDRVVFTKRLETYCKLYRETYSKYKKHLKSKGIDTTLLQDLESILSYHQYNNQSKKSVTESEKQKQDRSRATYTTLSNLEAQYFYELESLYKLEIYRMTQKEIFRKDDPEVVQTAINNSLRTFIHKYNELVDIATLTKYFHQIRRDATGGGSSDVYRVNTSRIPIDSSNSILEPSSPIGVVMPVGLDIVEEVGVTTTTTTLPSIITEGRLFKSLDNLNKETILSQLLDRYGWESNVGKLKPEIVKMGYVVRNYDDIYFPLDKLKRSRKK